MISISPGSSENMQDHKVSAKVILTVTTDPAQSSKLFGEFWECSSPRVSTHPGVGFSMMQLPLVTHIL